MKKVIVTGGSGFIGSNLIKFLIKKNFFVINIDKASYISNSYNLKNVKTKNFISYKLDINNKKKLLSIFRKYKPDVLFNLAAETHVDRSIDNPYKFIKSNILGVYNLLETLREYKKITKKNLTLVHVSTDEVYGDLKGLSRSSEDHPYSPSSPYSSSKASSDHLIKSYIRTYGLKAVISNCCNNYGLGQYPEKLIPTLIFNIINNKPLPIYGSGKNSREWIYVQDHCEALFQIYKKGKIGESYNVGSGKNLNNIEITNMLIKIIKKNKFKVGNKVKIKFVKDRPGHDLRYALNSNKIKKLIKWKAKRDLKSGLSETFNWYLENKSFFKSFSKKLFYKRLGLNI